MAVLEGSSRKSNCNKTEKNKIGHHHQHCREERVTKQKKGKHCHKTKEGEQTCLPFAQDKHVDPDTTRPGTSYTDIDSGRLDERDIRNKDVEDERDIRNTDVEDERDIRNKDVEDERDIRDKDVEDERDIRDTDVEDERDIRDKDVEDERDIRDTDVEDERDIRDTDVEDERDIRDKDVED